jgi:methylthioribose-1-phosphate isomerase
MRSIKSRFKTIRYDPGRNIITALDQTRLPEKETYLRLTTVAEVYQALKKMCIRGAPLIGVAAAYGVALVRRGHGVAETIRAADYLGRARLTAVNLCGSIRRMKNKLQSPDNKFADILEEARAIEREDIDACTRIGGFGEGLVRNGMNIFVHCNAGALATCGIGTALGVLYTAWASGKKFTVYAGETRPLFQGARLTTWELTRHGIPTYTLCDDMAAHYMPDMNLVLVGADRIAANGDTANKIGTRGLAIIARYHLVPFYVCAPIASFDPAARSGADIPIEMRPESEMRSINHRKIVAAKALVLNPAFDITPNRLITGIVTERGILRPPLAKTIPRMLRRSIKVSR